MGSVPAEACHQVPWPLRALRAGRPPKAALDGQRGGIYLLPAVLGQLGYEVPAQLLESAPEPADPPVKLALVRRAPVLADFLQESGFAGPSQDVPDRRRCRQALVPAFSPLWRRRPDMDKQVGPPRWFWVEHNPISDRRGPLLSRIHIMRLRTQPRPRWNLLRFPARRAAEKYLEAFADRPFAEA
jgi:hypothetical protein